MYGFDYLHSVFDDMSNTVQRILISCLCVWAIFDIPFAYSDHDDVTSGVASAHCASQAATQCDTFNAQGYPPNTTGACVSAWCVHDEAQMQYECMMDRYNKSYDYACDYACATCGDSVHEYSEITPECEEGLTGTYQGDGAPICVGGCEYIANGVSACSDGTCMGNYVSTGNTCSGADAPEPPEGCSVDGFGSIVCDCSLYPDAPYCPGGDQNNPNNCYTDSNGVVRCSDQPGDQDSGGGSGTNDPGDGLPPDDPGSNSPPVGDGDPNTPSGPGTGDGDTDGDDERDVDCDPNSNPDCAWTGSGQGSGNCDIQPSCNGDPVQCAILYQEWASMCYDETSSIINPDSCNATFECEGDKLKCELIRQQREQYCDLYVGDGNTDLDVTNDPDFDRDLKEEAEEIELPNIDQSGFASGSCPAPQTFAAFGGTFELTYQPFCDIAPYIRILVIMSALLSAAFIVTGTRH
jgi:hypothetical protein